ncbi:MAG: histidinol-phosphatase HisJ family protein [Coriobacteriia bacterium]
MIDLHVHTSRCGHAQGTVDEYVEAAREAGISILAFTDHLPLPTGFDSGYAMPYEELDAYVAEVLSAKERSAASGGPEVLLGVEADWLPGHESILDKALMSYPFDLVLGSVHFIDGWAFDDPRLTDGYVDRDLGELWERYFDDLSAAAMSRRFDVMAHPDLMKKFRHFPTSDPAGSYARVAATFASAGVAVEVNTAGLRKPCAELYPATAFLEACRRAGVPATVGSDAHAPEEVGAGSGHALAALRDAGYDDVCVFRARDMSRLGMEAL